VCVANSISEPSWQALVDSIEYKLRADDRRGRALNDVDPSCPPETRATVHRLLFGTRTYVPMDTLTAGPSQLALRNRNPFLEESRVYSKTNRVIHSV
jgi:hypothetical protein